MFTQPPLRSKIGSKCPRSLAVRGRRRNISPPNSLDDDGVFVDSSVMQSRVYAKATEKELESRISMTSLSSPVVGQDKRLTADERAINAAVKVEETFKFYLVVLFWFLSLTSIDFFLSFNICPFGRTIIIIMRVRGRPPPRTTPFNLFYHRRYECWSKNNEA